MTAAGIATIRLTLGNGHLQHCGGVSTFEVGSEPSASSPLALTGGCQCQLSVFLHIASSGTPAPHAYRRGSCLRKTRAGGNSFRSSTLYCTHAVVGTAALDPTSLGFILLPAPSSPATVGLRPQNIVLGDFNNDGMLDQAATNTSAGTTISVLLGNGDGSFQLQTAYAVGASPVAIASGYFNRDGNLRPGPGQRQCRQHRRLGNGDGTFLPQQIYAVENGPSRLPWPTSIATGFSIWRCSDRNDQT